MSFESTFSNDGTFLNENALEKILRSLPPLETFWNQEAAFFIIRSYPTKDDPVFEIQLILDLDTRIETYGWIWIDALEGQLIKMFPEP